MKYCISICSNSRDRKMKLPGVISLRNALPICAIPNGSFFRVVCWTFSKSTKIDCAVSGRSHAIDAVSSTGPTKVLNIRLNCRGSASLRSPQFGQDTPERSSFLARHAAASSSPFGRSSSRNRLRQLRHSTSGSVKFSTCPDASQTRGCMRMAPSSPTTSSRSWTIVRHQASLTLRLSSTPSGPKSHVAPAPP